MPSLVLYLSRWYRQNELTFRVSLFIVSASLAGAFGGLLASAISKLESFGSLHSWRMIFGIEGMLSLFLLFPLHPLSLPLQGPLCRPQGTSHEIERKNKSS